MAARKRKRKQGGGEVEGGRSPARLDKKSRGGIARTPSAGVKASARHASEEAGHTLPGTDKFPINSLSDLANAKHDIGRTNEPRAKVIAHINRQAKRLGGKPVGG